MLNTGLKKIHVKRLFPHFYMYILSQLAGNTADRMTKVIRTELP